MTTSEFVAAVILKATGKVSTASPGDSKYSKAVAVANPLIDEWEAEDDWNSLYNPAYTIGTVTTTDTFPLDPADVRKLSDDRQDPIRIYHTDGTSFTDFLTVEPTKLKLYDIGNYCAQIGNNLVFNHAFTPEHPAFGGTIKAPIFSYAAHLDSPSSVVSVDDPNWLVTRTSAEWVRNDIVRQNQFPNLINESNALLQKMKDTNEAQIELVSSTFHAPGTSW